MVIDPAAVSVLLTVKNGSGSDAGAFGSNAVKLLKLRTSIKLKRPSKIPVVSTSRLTKIPLAATFVLPLLFDRPKNAN